jgi:hypothetical protein
LRQLSDTVQARSANSNSRPAPVSRGDPLDSRTCQNAVFVRDDRKSVVVVSEFCPWARTGHHRTPVKHWLGSCKECGRIRVGQELANRGIVHTSKATIIKPAGCKTACIKVKSNQYSAITRKSISRKLNFFSFELILTSRPHLACDLQSVRRCPRTAGQLSLVPSSALTSLNSWSCHLLGSYNLIEFLASQHT